jgi:hypothetical protein
MKIKDYLKLSFKKPEKTPEVEAKIARRVTLQNKLEQIYSRLETIEICNSNSKYSDSNILAKYIFKDILDILSFFEKKANPPKDFVNFTPDTQINTSLLELQNLVLTDSVEEETNTKIEETTSELVYSIEKYIFKKNASEFENEYDNYTKRIRFQSIAVSILAIFILFSSYREYKKWKPIQADTAKLYYMNQDIISPQSAHMVVSDVKPSEEWTEVSFVLPNSVDVNNVKIEPIHQEYSRFQIKEIHYLNDKKEILRNKSLKLSKAGLVDNKEFDEICCAEGLKPGKLLPEKYLEFESINSNPSFYIKQELTKNVKEVKMIFRYIKNKNKFKD